MRAGRYRCTAFADACPITVAEIEEGVRGGGNSVTRISVVAEPNPIKAADFTSLCAIRPRQPIQIYKSNRSHLRSGFCVLHGG